MAMNENLQEPGDPVLNVAESCGNCGHARSLHPPWCRDPYVPGTCNFQYDLCSCREFKDAPRESDAASGLFWTRELTRRERWGTYLSWHWIRQTRFRTRPITRPTATSGAHLSNHAYPGERRYYVRIGKRPGWTRHFGSVVRG